jgi:hypothetical protein
VAGRLAPAEIAALLAPEAYTGLAPTLARMVAAGALEAARGERAPGGEPQPAT